MTNEYVTFNVPSWDTKISGIPYYTQNGVWVLNPSQVIHLHKVTNDRYIPENMIEINFYGAGLSKITNKKAKLLWVEKFFKPRFQPFMNHKDLMTHYNICKHLRMDQLDPEHMESVEFELDRRISKHM